MLPTDACRAQAGTIKISRINRHYKDGQPTVKPSDYEYEVPCTYCEFHNGTGIPSLNNNRYEDEINRINDAIQNPQSQSQTQTQPQTTPPQPVVVDDDTKYEPFWWTRE